MVPRYTARMIARRLMLVSPLATVAAIASLMASGAALAQNVPPPAVGISPSQAPPDPALPSVPSAAAPPQFQVEVLIFAYREFDRGEEQFAHERDGATAAQPQELRAPPVFDDSNFGPLAQNPQPGGAQPTGGAQPFGADATAPGQDTLAAEQTEFRFRLLRPEELQLTPQYRTLARNSQAYVPLLHGGWVQPGLPDDDARPIDLAMLGATNPMGSIRVYLSRFLHVNLDLSYQDSQAAAAAAAAPAPAPLSNELTELPIAPRYHLVADRPTRSGELHYFDHPAFGVLIKVTPVRVEQTSPGTPGTRPAA